MRDKENIIGLLILGHHIVLENFQTINYPIARKIQVQARFKKIIFVFNCHISIISITHTLVSKVKKF